MSRGRLLASLQICEEPNLNLPSVDGSVPNVLKAVVLGVVAAKEETRRLGLKAAIGFNAVPTFDPSDTFWTDLGSLADGRRFRQSLDYVGLDFFPDVFRPVPREALPDTIAAVLGMFRHGNLPQAGIPDSVPIRVCENGWPTGPGRTERRQAETLETVIRAVAACAPELSIDSYSFFALRDADSSGDGIFGHFGLLRDDYTPKEAFATYARLIRELGSPFGVRTTS